MEWFSPAAGIGRLQGDVTGDDVDVSESPDAAVAELSRRQFGAFSLRQAIDLGLPAATVHARRRAGRYVSLASGVLAESAAPDSWQRAAMAAQLTIGGEVALARQSAAQVHGLDLPPSLDDDRMHLLVSSRSFEDVPGLVVHRTSRLDADVDVVAVGPLRVTTVTRTICDLAGQMGPTALRRSVADAVRRGFTSAVDLRTASGRLGRIRGKRQLLAIVDELSPLDRDCRTELESAFVRVMTRAGYPPTAVNYPVIDAFGTRRRIDAVYLPEKLPVELDSRLAHGTLLDWHDDLRRENAVVLSGWRDFLRFSWDDVVRHPAAVVDTVRIALEAARNAPR